MKLYRFTLTPQSAFGTPLVGDSLFGQLCWAIANRFGQDRLTELLKGYTEQKPFMVVSDAFPKGYLPLPTLPSKFWEKPNSDNRKALKKLQWIQLAEIRKPVKEWQKGAFELQKQFDKYNEDNKTSKDFVKKEILAKASQDQYHNTINRQTGTTGEGVFAPYATDVTWYAKDQAFDLYVVLDEQRFSTDELKQVLQDVGQFGFGRDASIGLGKFNVELEQTVEFGEKNANCYLTLANCAPQNLGLDKARCFYQITTRFGRHGDVQALGSNPFKKPIILAKTAAIFTPNQYEVRSFLGNGLSNVSHAQPNAVHQGYAPVMPLSVEFPNE
ncbi:type III-A CRISPR-associated RAMP protein Csm4 [Actinobacillus equuli]|uniref:type III-A CRISPR-associated RAMP protein Csm4 n=1 Tax=Actinobacillus equuli TaxID=718 RepID=UPI0024419BE1|nr:RAMP superfamily CRISPR-associated protein [Actinobacillus equuli]WGE85081.1 CRISPR-associated protein Csm4 [Actinobacillus equuli subsp. haemolyticus]